MFFIGGTFPDTSSKFTEPLSREFYFDSFYRPVSWLVYIYNYIYVSLFPDFTGEKECRQSSRMLIKDGTVHWYHGTETVRSVDWENDFQIIPYLSVHLSIRGIDTILVRHYSDVVFLRM